MYRSGESFSAQWEAFQLSPRQAIYTVAFVLLTHIIIARGVEKGIEKASKIMMPLLFAILVVLAVCVLLNLVTLPGNWAMVALVIVWALFFPGNPQPCRAKAPHK